MFIVNLSQFILSTYIVGYVTFGPYPFTFMSVKITPLKTSFLQKATEKLTNYFGNHQDIVSDSFFHSKKNSEVKRNTT
jgi:hypothetical protein